MRFVAVIPTLWAALLSWFDGQPRLQLGGTVLIGRHLQLSNLDFFGGIPFAEPPVANHRLSPPRHKYSLSPLRSFDASSYGLPCLQPYSKADMSEDCLTLNVFRPSGIDINSSLPIMVWIYGGGFYSGASSLYDGAPLVEQSVARGTPMLFVSLNYRLGPLGFPQGPEAVEQGALNLGLRDQWAALEWVQNNIASFGGDPRKVTVFGESAGAMSTYYHYLNENFSNVPELLYALVSRTMDAVPHLVMERFADFPIWNRFSPSHLLWLPSNAFLDAVCKQHAILCRGLARPDAPLPHRRQSI
ncbi:Alpha/Beta hydrolase protein [Russula vinacea]|nr:Alpha/Beta hydrolase protein [Russula vinacea]